MDPFQENFSARLAAGEANGGKFQVVPAGKRAVIEHVSVSASGAGAPSADYFFTSTIGGNSDFREVPIVTQSGAQPTLVIGSHPLRAFADPETQFGAVIRRQDTTGDVFADFIVAGYYTQP
jgi:hypothetical protein